VSGGAKRRAVTAVAETKLEVRRMRRVRRMGRIDRCGSLWVERLHFEKAYEAGW
jgi:hypothetical protein